MVKKIIVAVVVFAVAGTIGYFVFHKSDKDLVKRQFALLADYASKYPGEGAAGMLMKIQAVASLFDETCSLDVGDNFFSGDYTPEEISSKSAVLRRQFSSAIFTFYDISVDIPEKDKAVVALTARFVGATGGETHNQTRELRVILKKKNNKWLFSEFKMESVLKK